MGTPDFAVPTLAALVAEYPKAVALVITMPDRPRGRRKQVSPSPVKQWACDHAIPVQTPESAAELVPIIQSIEPTLIVVVAYGRLIPATITNHYVCVNSHSSVLPQYRGASPIHTALLAGDTETGITLIRMNDRLDEGDILQVNRVPIAPTDNLASLTATLATCSASACVEFIHTRFLRGHLTGHPQDHAAATYTQKIVLSDLQVDVHADPMAIHNQIRAFSPKPGAYVMHHNKRIKLIESTLDHGKLVLTKVQPEGKPVMTYTDYLLGHPNGALL
jgi:methionyl-tRNA formyltransferase